MTPTTSSLAQSVRALMEQPADAARVGPHRRDWLLVGLMIVGFAVEATLRTDLTWPLASFATAAIMMVTTPWRRVRPAVTVWVAYSAAAVLTIATWVVNHSTQTTGVYSAAVPALLLPYALFRWGSGREIFVGKFALIMILIVSWATQPFDISETVGGTIVLILPCLLGWAVRWRTEARRRQIAEAGALEREALARELHDTIAHHVSAIAIQAQAGRAQAAVRPQAALDALDVISSEASRTLAEMRAMVRMLRANPDHQAGAIDDIAPLTPLATNADLERLASTDGPTITIRRDGHTAQLPVSVDHAVYRIVQESVTNVRRHAPHATRVDVVVRAVDDLVSVDVNDDGGRVGPVGRDGFGLLGMSERARTLGGSMTAGPTASGWGVHAELPFTPEFSSADR